MALYAFDGTWNEAKTGDDPGFKNTNVFRFFQAYKQHSGTEDLYKEGVGTRFDLVGRALGGVFGLGELSRIVEAYDHLCLNWMVRQDHVIDVVGFSRGAATTLDFCHYVLKKGIRRPGSDEVIEPSPQIRFLGVWDVVAAFGLANLGNTALNIGHHLELPRKNLQYCFHALALDERRPSFLPTRLPGAYEVWFRGAHSDIGGGNGNRGLNDVTMHWMMSKAKAAKLPIPDEALAALRPDPSGKPKPSSKLPADIRLVGALDRQHHTVSPLPGFVTPPSTCPIETATDERGARELGPDGIEVLPTEVRVRIATLWETADATVKANGYTLEHVHDALLTLLQGRIPLVTNAEELTRARAAVVRLMTTAVAGARQRGFPTLAEFFFTEALFKNPRLFPLTD
ncbi:MAG: DUF2235 domain-containing protein [Vicinamibacterales bacterium]